MGRKYYKKRNSSNNSIIEQVVALIFVLPIFLTYTIYVYIIPYYKTHTQEVILFSYIAIGILIVIGLIIWFFGKKKKKQKTEMLQGLIGDVVNEISEFKPLKRYRNELSYQMELAGYLRKTFPTLSIEENKEGTRPDIIVEDIAIEIKGPTGNSELRTIPDKIIRYLKQYDKLIVILFTLEVPQEEYIEWKEDIESTFEHKKEKLFILDI